MEMDLHDIFESITPESIKSIPVVETAMEVFINCIEKNSKVAKNITNLFDITEAEGDSEHLIRAKHNLKKGLYLTYIYTLWNCINDVLTDKDIQKNVSKNNYTNSLIYTEAENTINTEFVYASKEYSQNKGTEDALYYMYAFARYIETGEIENDLTITEGNPFVIYYEGSLSKFIFNKLVYPLAHPIGWIDLYTSVVSFFLQDYFGVIIETNLESIMIQNGAYWVVFTDESTETIYEQFRTQINPLTGTYYTDDEIASLITIIPGKTVSSYDYYVGDDGYIKRVVVFTDQTVMYYDTYTQTAYFTTYEDYLNGVQEPIYTYVGYSFDSTIFNNWKIIYYDTLEPFLKDVYVHRYRDDDHSVGDSEYMDDDMTNCFKVVGDETVWLPGADESRTVVENYNTNLEELEKFKTSIYVKSFYDGYFNIKDSSGMFQQFELECDGVTFDFSSYSIHSKKVTYEIVYYGSMGKYYLTVNNVNQFDLDFRFTYVKPSSDGTITFKGTRTAETPSFTYFVLTTSLGAYTLTAELGEEFEITFDIDEYVDDDNVYAFNIYQLNDLQHPINETIYESNILRQEDENYIQYVDYTEHGIFDYETSEIYDYNQMLFFDSDSEIEHVTIGELKDGGFAAPDEWIEDYIENGQIQFDQFSDMYQQGNVLEGNDYYNSYWWDEQWLDEEVFIYYGWRHKFIDTSDFIVTSSTRYVQDDFTIYIVGFGFYLVTTKEDDPDAGDRYFFTRDTCYLYTHEEEIEYNYYYIFVNVINGTIDVRYQKISVSKDTPTFTQEMFDNIVNNIVPDEGYTEYEINLGGLSIGNAITSDAVITIDFIQDDVFLGN